MRKYIVDLTNNLIRKHRLEEFVRKLHTRGGEESQREVVLGRLAGILEISEISEMRPETLGKILCSFEIGDVMAKNPFEGICFSGDVEESLRQLVARCLAYVIRDRLEQHSHLLPKYVK